MGDAGKKQVMAARVGADEKADVVAAAEASSTNVSALIREIVLPAVRRRLEILNPDRKP